MASEVAAPSQGRSVRVCVRVRPVTEGDGQTPTCSLLTCDGPNRLVSLSNPTDKRSGKNFKFDAVFDPSTSQEDLYKAAGITELVQAAASGYHATVFAYGQTGSGKTHTMEGFKYVSQGFTPVASTSKAAPHADFDATPAAQLGIVPRAVAALFDTLRKTASTRRATVRVSFVQLYKEQAYDLLNPTPLTLGTRPPKPGAPPQPGGALRMRWSKVEDFYLENLFKVECSTVEDVMAAFKSGVANKVMAAHRLNAASSRSHALFTLYIDTAPAASPTEVISSRLTLVDLAGSERQATTGATEGTLKDESVAINKSLFTLRQVIIALSNNSSNVTAAANTGSGVDGASGPPLSHVPYRDSKLTALLKNSLGGNSLTTMVACVSPADNAYEENVSTLEYAARAKHVTNQVSVNEDPKSKLIRELRAEVTFLKQQLAMYQGTSPPISGGVNFTASTNAGYTAANPPPSVTALLAQASTGEGGASGGPRALHHGVNGTNSVQGSPSQPGAAQQAGGGRAARPAQPGSQGDSNAGAGQGKDEPVALPQGTSMEAVKAQVIRSTQHDVGLLAQKFLDAVGLVQQLSSVNAQLRVACDSAEHTGVDLRIENDDLMMENAKLRDRLSMLESMVSMGEGEGSQPSGPGTPKTGTGPGAVSQSPLRGSPGASAPPSILTASSSALIELQELRRENTLLHERLRQADSNATGGSGSPAGAPQRRGQALSGPSLGTTGNLQRTSLPATTVRQLQLQTIGATGAGPGGAGGGVGAGAVGVSSGSPVTGSIPRPRQAGSAPAGAQDGVLSSMPPSTLSVAELRGALSSNNLSSPSASITSQGSETLSQATHRVAARALGANVRMSTVGQVLPAAAARAQAGVVPALPSGASGAATSPSLPGRPGVSAEDPAERLGQLMAQRNALMRARLADGTGEQ